MILNHVGCSVSEQELFRAAELCVPGVGWIESDEVVRLARLFGQPRNLQADCRIDLDLASLSDLVSHERFPIVAIDRRPIDGEWGCHSVVLTSIRKCFVGVLDPLRETADEVVIPTDTFKEAIMWCVVWHLEGD